MYSRVLEGWPTLKFSEKFDMPELIDCMASPFVFRASLDDAYKYGGEVHRYFIDRAPLSNNSKYYSFFLDVKFIRPGICPISTTAWHCDGSIYSYKCNDLTHTYIGDSSELMTQFLSDELTVEDNVDIEGLTHMEIREYLEKNQERFGFKVKEVEPNRFTTFNSRHVHRVLTPQKPEFRFFVQIRESNEDAPLSWEKSIKDFSKVHIINDSLSFPSVASFDRTKEYGLILRNKI